MIAMRKMSVALLFLAMLFAIMPCVTQALACAVSMETVADDPVAAEPEDIQAGLFFLPSTPSVIQWKIPQSHAAPADDPVNPLWRPPIAAV